MPAASHLRGHPIEWDALRQHWVYCDNRESTAETWRGRACGHCGRHSTTEGHDACLGTLPGVMNACCGHGHVTEAYVQFEPGCELRGHQAREEIKRLRTEAAPLISSQRHLDRDKVLHKARNFRVFTVKIHECELRGKRYRMVVDGHHNLAAAHVLGVQPSFKPVGDKFLRYLSKLKPSQREAFLINNLSDSDHYFIETGEVVAELLPVAEA